MNIVNGLDVGTGREIATERGLRVLICGGERAARVRFAEQLSAAGKGHINIDELPVAGQAGGAEAVFTADAAVLIVDADDDEAAPQIAHLLFLLKMLRVPSVVLAIDAPALQSLSQDRYVTVLAQTRGTAERLHLPVSAAVPVSSLGGENVGERSELVPWHAGPSLAEAVLAVPDGNAREPLRFIVETIERGSKGLIDVTGSLLAGSMEVGEQACSARSGACFEVQWVTGADGHAPARLHHQRLRLRLNGAPDLFPGELLAAADGVPDAADQYAAHIAWLDAAAMVPGRDYLLRGATTETIATVSELKHRVNTGTGAHEAAKTLGQDEIGLCNLSLHEPVQLDSYAAVRSTGSFLLLDRQTRRLAGLATVEFALRRATNIQWQHLVVTKSARAAIKKQVPAVLWLTGLSGSGKSTIANLVEKRLHSQGFHTFVLDGDNVRHGLNRDLGFTEADRVENIRRVAEVARLFAEAGLIVIVSFISPFRAERQMARELLAADEFIEIFIDTPLEECARRDPKGLYAKAMRGDLKNFTGIDSPYEAPEAPELRLATASTDAETLAERVESFLRDRGIVSG